MQNIRPLYYTLPFALPMISDLNEIDQSISIFCVGNTLDQNYKILHFQLLYVGFDTIFSIHWLFFRLEMY